MKKIIEIDLYNEETLYEKYNKNIVSKELISYVIEQAMFISKYDTISVLVHNKCNVDKKYLNMIKEGLELEYKKKLRNHFINNIKQVILLLIGILFLFISTIIKDGFIFKEVFLIIGWVPIWEVIEIEMFTDVEERRTRKILKKLLESEFELV